MKPILVSNTYCPFLFRTIFLAQNHELGWEAACASPLTYPMPGRRRRQLESWERKLSACTPRELLCYTTGLPADEAGYQEADDPDDKLPYQLGEMLCSRYWGC